MELQVPTVINYSYNLSIQVHLSQIKLFTVVGATRDYQTHVVRFLRPHC